MDCVTAIGVFGQFVVSRDILGTLSGDCCWLGGNRYSPAPG